MTTSLPRIDIRRAAVLATALLALLLLALPASGASAAGRASAHRAHPAAARCARARGGAHRRARCSDTHRGRHAGRPAAAPLAGGRLQAEPVGSYASQPEAAGPEAQPASAQALASGSYTPPAGYVASSVVGWGENVHGQLAAGFHSRWLGPQTLQLPGGIREISLGMGGGLALTQSGYVYAWGGNIYGQNGLGYRNRYALLPQRLPTLSNVVQIAATGSHAMALLANGTVMVWGSNLYGELGNGTSTHGHEVANDYVDLPQPVPGLREAVYVATGGSTDAAVLRNGTVVGWGENSTYQLGDGTRNEKDTPVHVRGLENVRAISVGGFPAAGAHIIAILSNGTLMGTGRNDQGQLGPGNPEDASSAVPVRGLSNVSAVSADVTHTLALTAGGQLYAFGGDEYGQIGTGPAPETCRTGPCSRNPLPVPIGPVTSISAGFRYSAAVSGGHVYEWGSNLQGQLGDGTTAQKDAPTLVPGIPAAGSVAASYYYTVAGSSAPGPSREVEMSRVAETLVLHWAGASTQTNWHISWRAAPNGAWTREAILPPTARSYTIKGLNFRTAYEVRLQSNPENVKVLQWGEAFPALWPVHTLLEPETVPPLAGPLAPATEAATPPQAEAPAAAEATSGTARTRRAGARRARHA